MYFYNVIPLPHPSKNLKIPLKNLKRLVLLDSRSTGLTLPKFLFNSFLAQLNLDSILICDEDYRPQDEYYNSWDYRTDRSPVGGLWVDVDQSYVNVDGRLGTVLRDSMIPGLQKRIEKAKEMSNVVGFK